MLKIKTADVVMVRVYMTESSHLLSPVVHYLKDELKVRGFSVFRAISGYGETGEHKASLIDLSLDLPLVVEFFDNKDTISLALSHLNTLVKSEHIVFWDAKINVSS